jgi:hypothetical protein
MLLRRKIRWGTVGIQLGADGTTPAVRQARTGDTVVSQGHGKYYELCGRGAVFCASDAGAGIAPMTALSGTTACLTLANPANNTKRLAILKVAIGYFSGTVGSGSFYHGILPPTVAQPSSGSGASAFSLAGGLPNAPAATGVAKTGATVTASTANPLWPICSFNLGTAATTNPATILIEDVDGAICIDPGAAWTLLSVLASSSSPKISVGIVWAEVPYAMTMG